MISRKVSIPLIIIVVTVVVLLVSIENPYKLAEANERQESYTSGNTPVQEPQSSETEKQLTFDGNLSSANDPALPSVKLEEPTDLVKVNELLKEKINISSLQPGWFQFIREYTSFLDTPSTTTVPENGQIIPRDYRLEQWLLVTDDNKITVLFIKGTSLSGQEYTATLYSKDPRWVSPETAPLDNLNLPSILGTRELDDTIALGFAGDTKIEYRSEENSRVVTITTITKFPHPIGFNGWEEAKVVEYALTYFYNWETGSPLRSEEVITREDGTQMLAGISLYTLSRESELPADIVARLDNLGN